MKTNDTSDDFEELDFEMVMDPLFRNFLASIDYPYKIRHSVDGRFMIAIFTNTCLYNFQYAPSENGMLTVITLPSENSPHAVRSKLSHMIYRSDGKIERSNFDAALAAVVANEIKFCVG